MCYVWSVIDEKGRKEGKQMKKQWEKERRREGVRKRGRKHKIRGQTKTITNPTRMGKEDLFEKVTFALRLNLEKERSQRKSQPTRGPHSRNEPGLEQENQQGWNIKIKSRRVRQQADHVDLLRCGEVGEDDFRFSL